MDSFSVLFLFICSVFTRFPHHYVILSPSSRPLGCFTLNSLKAFPMHPKAQLNLYVSHLHLLSLSSFCYYLPFWFQRFSKGSTFFFWVLMYFVFIFMLFFSAFLLYFFLNVWVVAASRGNVVEAASAKDGEYTFNLTCKHNDAIGFNLVLSLIYYPFFSPLC